MKTYDFPFSPEENLLLEKLFESLDNSKLYWLHGYIQAKIQSKSGENIPQSIAPRAIASPQITVLFGTQTSNSRKIAIQLNQKLITLGLPVRLSDLADYKNKDVKSEKILLLIISTQGEGEPPLTAEDFYEFIHSKHSPSLPELSYAVLALGDKSYFNYCKTGADIDLRLEQLGATRLIPRSDCDLDYAKTAEVWISDVVQSLAHLNSAISTVPKSPEVQSQVLPARDKPIEALVVNKIKLNGRGSDKTTYHVELQLPSEQIIYEAGDSVGIIPCNHKTLVNEMIHLLGANLEMPVVFQTTSGSLGSILTNEVELTKLTRENLEKYNKVAGNEALNILSSDVTQLSALLNGCTWADLLRLYPGPVSAETFLSIARPIQPRLYSISSSAKVYPGEVHLTVRQVNYNLYGQEHSGICSTYLADMPETEDRIRIFFETNDIFRLPSGETDIIMIGPGTGVAPFRAFMQEREELQATGKNWLFFGDWRFTTDFLYQTEWQDWKKKSLLHRIDLAFSRDQLQKIYVQHRLVENSRDIYDWIENGAKIYVCGDMKNMAADVNKAFVHIVMTEGGISAEKAQEYVKGLRKQKRYLEDVY